MTMRLHSLLLGLTAILLVTLTGCAGVTVTPAPVPSGDGIAVDKDGVAKIDLPDKEISIRLDGYHADVAFVGPIVPIFPIPGFVSSGESRLTIYMFVKPKMAPVVVHPESIRLNINGQSYAATSTFESASCTAARDDAHVTGAPVSIDGNRCFRLKFENISAPKTEFSITGDELPIIKYTPSRKLGGGFLGD